MSESEPHSAAQSDTLDESSLELLIALDEALRTGSELGESVLTGTGSKLAGSTCNLTSAAMCLLELESAYPRVKGGQASAKTPGHIGRFEITGELGAGGFGIVYRGIDPELNRTVAIKVPRHRAFATLELRRRFVREAHAAAKLDHPNMVPIYEAGEVDGLPFIAYAYCEGPTLGRWCSQRQELMAPHQAARLMLPLVEAIAYCHSRGILHRDIKPSNILLFPKSEVDEDPLPFIPKLSDLGLSKVIESNMDESMSTMLAGTPTYMSPEQGNSGRVGPAADVYSLGATLYFLLTGRPPFLADKLADLLKQLMELDPVEPTTLNPAVDAELNTICIKCLEKEPGRRYGSAQALADDLKRYLAGIPIQARPSSSLYRIRRWCQRRPAVAALVACLCTLTTGLVGTLLVYNYKLASITDQLEDRNAAMVNMIERLDRSLKFAEQQKQVAVTNEYQSRQLLYATNIQAAGEAWSKRDYSAMDRLLSQNTNQTQLREFSGRYLGARLSNQSMESLKLGAQIWHIATSHDGRRASVSDATGRVHLVDIADQLVLTKSWDTGQREVNCTAFSPDDKWLATAGDDGRVGLWRADTGEHVRWLDAFVDKPVYGVEFSNIVGEPSSRESAECKLVACGNTPELVVWNASDYTQGKRLATPHTLGIEALSIAPDGSQVATVGNDGLVRVHRLSDLELAWQQDVQDKLVVVRYDSTGKHLLTGSKLGDVSVWNATTGAREFQHRLSDPITAVAMISLDKICVTDKKGIVSLLKADSYVTPPDENPAQDKDQNGTQTPLPLQLVRVYSSHEERMAGLALSDNGQSILTGGSAGMVARWSVFDGKLDLVLPTPTEAHETWPNQLVISDRHSELFRVSGNQLEKWDLQTGRHLSTRPLSRQLQCCTVSNDQNYLALADTTGGVAIEEFTDRAAEPPLADNWLPLFAESHVDQLAVVRDGQLILGLLSGKSLVVHDLKQNRRVATFAGRDSFAVSPDGRWLACGCSGSDDLEIIDMNDWQCVKRLPAHSYTIWTTRFSRDGRLLLTTSGDRQAKIWSTDDWSCKLTLVGHMDSIKVGDISADNQTIVTGDISGKLAFWYATTGQRLFEIALPNDSLKKIDFTADGNSLVLSMRGHNTYILRAP